MFFLQFWCTSLEFQRILLYPLEFSIDILNREGYNFFSGKAHFIVNDIIFEFFFIPSDTQLPGMEPVAIGSTGEPFSDEWRHNAQQVML